MIKEQIQQKIQEIFGLDFVPEICSTNFEGADFAVSPKLIFEIVKKAGTSAEKVKEKIIESATQDLGCVASVKNGFVNISIRDISQEVRIFLETDNYLEKKQNHDKTIVIDYSAPNIAKRFSIGNLRSTIIGAAVANSYKALGYKVEGINHLGDWGTQFGKLVVAIEKWGDKKEIEKNPLEQLSNLYIRFHREAQSNPALVDEARLAFKKLESGDERTRVIWRKCINWSMKEFDHYYDELGIHIENIIGESFYDDKTVQVIRELDQKGLLKESEGAKIVEFDHLPPAVIQKKDEATLYITRDLASIKYRIEKFKPTKMIYHVGLEQQLHFTQLFEIVRMLGWAKNVELVYAGHGLVKLPSGKMSAREGNVVLLEELIREAKERVRDIFKGGGADKIDEDKVKAVAIGAIKYTDLKQNRKTNIVFDWANALDLNGNSGPYLQYAYARISSVISKSGLKIGDLIAESNEMKIDKDQVKDLIFFQDVVNEMAENEMPNLICNFAYKIASKANSYYERVRVLNEDKDELIKNIMPLFVWEKLLRLSFEIIGLEPLKEV